MKPPSPPSKTLSPELTKRLDAMPPDQRKKVIRAAAVLLASKLPPRPKKD